MTGSHRTAAEWVANSSSMSAVPNDPARPPGTRPAPLLGDLLAFGRNQLSFLARLQRRYGDVAEFSLGSARVAVFFRPEDVKTVFAAAGADGPLGRGQEGTYARHAQVTGNNGLILSDGDYWKRQRRILLPGMHHQWIARYAAIIVKFSEEALASWQIGQERDAQEDMEQLVGRIAIRTLLGADASNATIEKLKRTSNRLLVLNAVEYAFGAKLPLWLPTPWRWLFKRTSRRMECQIMGVVEQRLKETLSIDGEPAGDMLDMLLMARDEDGRALTAIELRDEVYTLYLGGYETTANTLGILMTVLAGRPDLQHRITEEVERVVGDDELGYQHVDELSLIGAVVKETLRMYPVVRAISHTVERPVRVAGYEFPPGHLLWVAPPVTQRDSRWFPEPDEFRPDRWLDGSTDDIPRYAWFPFGGGPRICLGQRLAITEASLIVAAVFRRFALTAAPNQPADIALRINGGGHLMSAKARVVLCDHDHRPAAPEGKVAIDIEKLPRGGPAASWLDRKFQTTRLEFLDREDIDPKVKQSVVRSLKKFGERNGYNQKFARFALEQVRDVDSPRILELGAGHGGLSATLLEMHRKLEATVTDLDPGSVKEMAAGELGAHPRATVQVADATAIKAPDQAYDLAIFAQSFHHLPPGPAAAAIAEATRVARKFIIIDLRRIHPAAQLLRLPLFFAVTLIGEGYATAHDWCISELRAYSPAALSALAQHSGCNIHAEFSKDLVHQFAVLKRED